MPQTHDPSVALMAWMNKLMGEYFEPGLKSGQVVTVTPKGTRIVHPRGRNAFQYYQCGPLMFAYTSLPDTHGDYWAWTYKPKGKGSRTKPSKWVAKDIVSFRHKGKAMRRAEARLNAYRAKLAKQKEAK
jgi:hypothetical protein